MIAKVITSWEVVAGENRPELYDIAGIKAEDVTGASPTPDPNSVIWLVEGSEEKIQEIDDDNRFFIVWTIP